MVGAFAVGKTCLVQLFVSSIFDEKYMTTVGVKIDRKEVCVDGESVQLMLWDIQGEDRISRLQMNYLRGASGLLFVIDGTRRETLTTALTIREMVNQTAGIAVPGIALFNKSDLASKWEVTEDLIKGVEADGMPAFVTSAKNGEQVETAFHSLTQMMIA